MHINQIEKLADTYEHSVGQGIFGKRFVKLLDLPFKEAVKHHRDVHSILQSELEELRQYKAIPKMHEIIRLIGSAISMFEWAERARHSKRKSEEIGALGAAASVLEDIKKAYLKLK